MVQDFQKHRQELVQYLRSQGICDAHVLAALASVPREHFVPASLHTMAYADDALPLELGQTISQPLIVGMMTQALHLSGKERVLEIGTGSGYQTALLAQLSSYVYSIERHASLACRAAQQLVELSYTNISIYIADGSLGWPESAPYDRILLTAAAPQVPASLFAQLAPGGILLGPIGEQRRQELQLFQRTATGIQMQSLGRCVFVPLIGEEGWSIP